MDRRLELGPAMRLRVSESLDPRRMIGPAVRALAVEPAVRLRVSESGRGGDFGENRECGCEV